MERLKQAASQLRNPFTSGNIYKVAQPNVLFSSNQSRLQLRF